MTKAITTQEGDAIVITADGTYTKGDVVQLPDGRAGVVLQDVASGNPSACHVGGVFEMLKTTSMVLLRGGRAYWDYSADKVYFRPINDRDFYVGRIKDDAASAATTCYVALNVRVKYDIDAKVDPGLSVPVGTAAAGAFGRGVGWKGGAVPQPEPDRHLRGPEGRLAVEGRLRRRRPTRSSSSPSASRPARPPAARRT
jgi:predicted RecA/RadA family phage recombinase